MLTFNIVFKISSDSDDIPYSQRRLRHQAGEVIAIFEPSLHPGSSVVDGSMFRVVQIRGVPKEVISLLSARETAKSESDLLMPRVAMRRILLRNLPEQTIIDIKYRVPFDLRGTYYDAALNYSEILNSYVLTKAPEKIDIFGNPVETIEEGDASI